MANISQYIKTILNTLKPVAFSGNYDDLAGKPTSLPTGFKNFIMNGDMAISQRGASWTNPAGGTYTLDRWQASQTEPGGTRILSQVTCTPGETEGILGASALCWSRHQRTVAGTGADGQADDFAQRIEDVTRLAGKTITISFIAKAAAAKTIQLFLQQIYNPDAYTSPGASVDIGTGVAKYSVTLTVPSSSGKVIGLNHHTCFFFSFPRNTTFDIYIKDVQIEIGSVATSFEIRPFALELALCQRYYETSYSYGTPAGTNAGGSLWLNGAYADPYLAMVSIPFKVEKRIVPAVTIYSGDGTVNTVLSYSGNLPVSSLAEVTTRGIGRVYTSTTSGPVTQSWRACNFVANAEY